MVRHSACALEAPVNPFFLSLFYALPTENLQLRNDLNINLDLSGATVNLMAMLKIAVSRFFEFPLRDLFNLDCWLATIPAPELDKQGLRRIDVEPTAMLAEFVASIAALNLNISCVECSSPRMVELIDLLATRDAQDIATETANRVIEYFQKLMSGNFLQIQIDRALTDASKRCPHSPNYKPDFVSATYDKLVITDSNDSTSFLILLGSVVLVLFAVLGLAVLAVRWLVRRRHRKWLLTVSQEQVSNIARKQEETRAKEAQLNAATHAMYASPEIPGFVRWSMPLIIIGNIGFFLSGHLSLGATVNIEAEFAGEKIVVEKFFEFSMASSTVDIWNAGGHELAILILIFSGIWPYTKQLITLVLWFLPPTLCSTSRRGSILLWLDCLAKWSIIDIFVLVISIAAFRVSIVSPDVAFLPKNFYSINLLVVPLWGLYANMIAQLISQISSHFIIHYHRKIVHEWENRKINAVEDNGFNDNDSEDGLDTILSDDNISGTGSGCIADILHQHHFGRPHRGQEEKLAIRGWVNKSLIASAIGLVVFVILGCTLPSLSLNILGIVGLAVESGQGFEDANTQHNIFTVVQLLFDEARFLGTFGDWIGLGTLSILLIFTVLIAPLVLCAVLLRQWFVASTGIQRARIAIVIETLQAWQYSEVYLIAIFVASW